MNEESYHANLSPQKLIDSLPCDIEVFKEILERYFPCPENIFPQLLKKEA